MNDAITNTAGGGGGGGSGAAAAAGGGGGGGAFSQLAPERVHFVLILEAHGKVIGPPFSPIEKSPSLGGIAMMCLEGGWAFGEPARRAAVCSDNLSALPGPRTSLQSPAENIDDMELDCHCKPARVDYRACGSQSCRKPNCGGQDGTSAAGCDTMGIYACDPSPFTLGSIGSPILICALKDMVGHVEEAGHGGFSGTFRLSKVIAFIQKHVFNWFNLFVQKHNHYAHNQITPVNSKSGLLSNGSSLKYGLIIQSCRPVVPKLAAKRAYMKAMSAARAADEQANPGRRHLGINNRHEAAQFFSALRKDSGGGGTHSGNYGGRKRRRRRRQRTQKRKRRRKHTRKRRRRRRRKHTRKRT